MPNTRDINRRIRSVRNTRQITKAMEMVAATKMRRAQGAVTASRDYADVAQSVLAAAAGSAEQHGQPLLAKRPVKTLGLVVVGSDRGLCGAMNTNLLRSLRDIEHQGAKISYVAVGRKIQQALSRQGGEMTASFTDLGDLPQLNQVLPVAQVIREEFTAARVDQVMLCFPRFVSTLANVPEHRQILPAIPQAIESASTGAKALTIFEPSSDAVLESLLPRVLEVQLYQALLETKASEHSSRMMAMSNASTNAGDLLEELQFSFNQARQAAITTEIAEIAAASAMA